MARTTIAAVQKIISYDAVLIPDIQPFIDDASLMVTNIIGTAASEATLEMVERYLAAHLIGISDPRIQSEQVRTIQASYQVKLSDGLGITHYGSMAMQLDTSGKLSRWNKAVIAGMASAFSLVWGGKDVATDPNGSY
jgi:hypothetical protein